MAAQGCLPRAGDLLCCLLRSIVCGSGLWTHLTLQTGCCQLAAAGCPCFLLLICVDRLPRVELMLIHQVDQRVTLDDHLRCVEACAGRPVQELQRHLACDLG